MRLATLYLDALWLLQMVATEDTSNTVTGHMETPGTFGKLRQTLSSSLLNAQDKG